MFLRTALFLLLLPACAAAQAIDATWVGQLSGPVETACVLIVPGGAGASLADARTPTGEPIDATVVARIVDSSWVPAANYAAADVWLEFPADAGTVSQCIFGSPAFPMDSNTDRDGMTRLALPLPGGGWSEGPAVFYVHGQRAETPAHYLWPLIPLQVNSPDINGDRVVDLSDIVLFAGDYLGTFHMRSDLRRDGVVNLADVAVMAAHLGADCR